MTARRMMVNFDRFTAADEAVMSAVAAQLRARGLEVERDAALDLDCYWITEEGSTAPAWVIYREGSGHYLLRDGLLGLERAGDCLIEILPSEWLCRGKGQ